MPVIRGALGLAVGGQDDVITSFGTGNPVGLAYDTSDANANHLKFQFPTGGSVDVPIMSLGIGNFGVDEGFFNGLTQPEFVVLDLDRDSYIGLGHSADDVASIYSLTSGGSRTESMSFTETQTKFGGVTSVVPLSSDLAALGTTALMWADLFLASGGVINWNNGDVTATHAANTLTFAGASSGYVFDNGNVYVSDTANANMTVGLTLNQGANDNEILALKSSDVGHAMTGSSEADSYARFQKNDATAGGLNVTAYTESNVAVALYGMVTTTTTTKTTGGRGPLELIAYETDGGTSVQAIATGDSNMLVIRNATTTRFIFDIEGSGHADVEWVAFDSHNDLALMDALQREMGGRITPQRYGENPLYYERGFMETTGIVGKDSWHIEHRPDGRAGQRQMVNFTKLAMLHHGALLQVGDRLREQEALYSSHEERLDRVEEANHILRGQLETVGILPQG